MIYSPEYISGDALGFINTCLIHLTGPTSSDMSFSTSNRCTLVEECPSNLQFCCLNLWSSYKNQSTSLFQSQADCSYKKLNYSNWFWNVIFSFLYETQNVLFLNLWSRYMKDVTPLAQSQTWLLSTDMILFHGIFCGAISINHILYFRFMVKTYMKSSWFLFNISLYWNFLCWFRTSRCFVDTKKNWQKY